MNLSDVMSAAGLSSWAEVALILCFIIFTAIVIWVFFFRSKPSWEHQRSLPLEDDRATDIHPIGKGGDLS
jgi:cbb3-type cytochrome oxidase subunit 3